MEVAELLKLLGSGGISVVALVLLARITSRVGERMIGAIDKLVAEVGALRAEIVVLSTRTKTLDALRGRLEDAAAEAQAVVQEWEEPRERSRRHERTESQGCAPRSGVAVVDPRTVPRKR